MASTDTHLPPRLPISQAAVTAGYVLRGPMSGVSRRAGKGPAVLMEIPASDPASR